MQKLLRSSSQVHPLFKSDESVEMEGDAAGPYLRRVGLRAPQNEQRERAQAPPDLGGHSCRSVYGYYCKQYDVDPKQADKSVLSVELDAFDLTG